MIDIAGDLRGLKMQRISGKPEDAKEPGQPFPCALLGPIERGALQVSVDDD